jgi:capsular exopolysaccharide synthesis family protein
MTTASVSTAQAAALPGASTSNVDFTYEFSDDLVTLTEARPAEAEAIRTVRTHIMARHVEDGRRGLAICAPTPGVGCTFTAVNLAVALSQVGLSTLLIDADLRAPQVDSFIKPSGPTAGLGQYLAAADRRAGDFIHHDVLPNLSVMYAGGVTDHAQELLASGGFRRLIEPCLRDFEFTVVDTPPGATVADALRIASVIGYTLIVAKAHKTRTRDVAEFARQLQEDGAQIVGAVLNEI